MEKGKKNPHYGQISRGCTGTKQSCTDTGSVLFFYFDQCSYFGHNYVISYPILVIQVSSQNRLQGEPKILIRYLQILILCGPKIHSKWGYVQANF